MSQPARSPTDLCGIPRRGGPPGLMFALADAFAKKRRRLHGDFLLAFRAGYDRGRTIGGVWLDTVASVEVRRGVVNHLGIFWAANLQRPRRLHSVHFNCLSRSCSRASLPYRLISGRRSMTMPLGQSGHAAISAYQLGISSSVVVGPGRSRAGCLRAITIPAKAPRRHPSPMCRISSSCSPSVVRDRDRTPLISASPWRRPEE